MAKILTTKSYYKFPCIWIDPDTSKNRIFLDNFGYDLTTLAPKFVEHWQFQGPNNTYNNSAATDFDPWGPIQLGVMDGNAWTDGDNGVWSMPGIFNLWQTSLDYKNYPPTRIFKSGGGRTVATYPRSYGANETTGDWWIGLDMAQRSQAVRFGDTLYYCHNWEHQETVTLSTATWLYTGTLVTVFKPNHGLVTGDTITVSGITATTSTNAPNGVFIVTTASTGTFFNFTAPVTPTGSTGTITVTGTTWRGYGIEHENTIGAKTTQITGHNYALGQDIASPPSRPLAQALNTGGWKFFLGQDGTYVWYVTVQQASATYAGQPYSVHKYLLAGGAATETQVLAATSATNSTSTVFGQMPSNLRHDTTDRKVFYSSHFRDNTTTATIMPLRFVWTTSTGVVSATDCVLTYPSGTTTSTYYLAPTASTWSTSGYNSYWMKAHQFTKDNVNYITFCSVDQYIYSNTARFPTLKSRTWLTFSIANSPSDNQLTFHSGINFLTANDFPMSFLPYNDAGDKLVLFSNNGTGIHTFNTTAFIADSWSYSTSGGLTLITVTEPNHGLTTGNIITTSGATATTNPPNGIYRVNAVVDANTFNFVVDSNTSGMPSGTAGGSMLIRLGWQPGTVTQIRARGYGLDTLGRLWVTTRTTGQGRNELHLISETTPAKISVVLGDPSAGTTTKYSYAGTPINTTLLVNSYDSLGARLVTSVTLTISGTSMSFADGSKAATVTTSGSTDAAIPVVITSAGVSTVSASINF